MNTSFRATLDTRRTPEETVGRNRLLVVFVVAVIAFLVQTGVREFRGEPYPGFYQPAFGSSPPSSDALVTDQPVVEVTYEDGRTNTFDHREIMQDARVLEIAAFKSAYSPRYGRPNDPGNISWLEQRVEELGPGTTAASAVIYWRSVTYDPTSPESPSVTVDDTTTFDFGSTR